MTRPARAPRYCHGFVDRHGVARWYFRKAGRRTPLPGLPWSPEFMATYETAASGGATPGAGKKAVPGTVNDMAAKYLASPGFTQLAQDTQRVYRRYIERFRADHGGKMIRRIEPRHLRAIIDAHAATAPHGANTLRKVVRGMLDYAVEAGMLDVSPAAMVKRVKARAEGWRAWTEDDIEAYEATHAIGTPARLALALMLYTGQRRSDIVRMGPQHVRGGKLRITQQKTGERLTIPIHPDLREAIDAAGAAKSLCFLMSATGKGYTPGGLSNLFKRWCKEAGLDDCSGHGLRKACSARLAEAGATAHQIMSITGHKTLAEVERYTRAARQDKLAVEAVSLMTKRGNGNPVVTGCQIEGKDVIDQR